MPTIKKHQFSTVSDRLNYLFDLVATYPRVNEGRARAIGEKYGFGKSTVQRWIEPDSNNVPSRDKGYLRKLVAGCLEELNSEITVDSVVMWIEFGSIAPNPFTHTPGLVDHKLLHNVYQSIQKVAKKQGIDIYAEFDSIELNNLVTDVIDNLLPDSKVDIKIISLLIDQALN